MYFQGTMAMDSGKNFEGEVRASLKKARCFWFRIQDTNDVSRFVNKGSRRKATSRFYGSCVKEHLSLLNVKQRKEALNLFLYFMARAEAYLNIK